MGLGSGPKETADAHALSCLAGAASAARGGRCAARHVRPMTHVGLFVVTLSVCCRA